MIENKTESGYPLHIFSVDDIPLMTEAQRKEFLKVWEAHVEMLSQPITKISLIYGTKE